MTREEDRQVLDRYKDVLKGFGWGPERETFTSKEPADYVTFNSITDNAGVGDERNFVRVREAGTQDKFGDVAKVIPDHEYEVYIYLHNNAKSKYNKTGEGISKGLKVSSWLHQIVSKEKPVVVHGVIECENANPPSVWNSAVFYTDSEEPVKLLYVPDSAEHRIGDLVKKLPKALLTKAGTLTGYDKLDGCLPACAEYSGYIIYRLHAVKWVDEQ